MIVMEPDYSLVYSARLFDYCLKPGDRIHIGVVGPGQQTDDAVLIGIIENQRNPKVIDGIRVRIGDRTIPDLLWGDLIELWKLDARGTKISDDVMASP